ncbi:MAG: MFS transporter [Sphingobacteriaceae bacterium]|nr:MAG: MFS transporter [Sphingobacteriaceae bacterium]
MAEAIQTLKSPKTIRIATAVFFFISGFGYATWASRIPTLQQKLHLNEAELGSVLFALPAGLMLTIPVTSWFLSRYSSNKVMFAGTVCFNLMLALLGFTTQVWQLVLLLFCFGSSRNLMNISVNAQSVGVQALYKQSIITTFHGIWSLAGFAAAALGYLMVSEKIPPPYHFLVVGLMLIAVAFYFYSNTLNQQPTAQMRKPAFTLPDESLVKFGLISFASMACEGTMYDWSGIYFQKEVHATSAIATAGFVVYMVAMTTGRFFGDRLANRIGIKPMLHYSGLLILTGMLLAALFPVALVAGFGFILIGFGVACVVPLVFSIAGKSKTLSSGSAIASVSTVGYLGFLMVPPVVGFIAQAASLRWSFAVMAALGGLMVFMVRQIKE